MSNDTLDEARQKKYQAEMFIQVGIGYGQTMREALVKFFTALKDLARDKDTKEALKQLEGRRFTNEGQFILDNKQYGNYTFMNTAVHKDELKEFHKLCKSYGIDYLYQKRPDNLEELFRRKQNNESLSKNQESILNAFTEKDDKGNMVLSQHSAYITFAERDISIMEKVLDKMEERTYSIEQNKLKAERIASQIKQKTLKAKEKMQTKTSLTK